MSEQLLVDKIEQIWGNVLIYTTKYKEQLNTRKRFRQKVFTRSKKIDTLTANYLNYVSLFLLSCNGLCAPVDKRHVNESVIVTGILT